MPPSIDTGHAKNIANFQDLISFCQGYAAAYNPSKENLKITQLQNLYKLVEEKFYRFKNQKATLATSTNERRNAFHDLKPLCTKVVNAFAVSGANSLALDNIKSINKKIQGASGRKNTTHDAKNTEPDPLHSPIVSVRNVSTSQQSYDNLLDHFANLVQALNQHSAYAPNEEKLKLESLQQKLVEMKAKNANLIAAYTQYSNAMIERNQACYNPTTGLVQTAKEVKQYIKSVFGPNSPQYKQLTALKFSTMRVNLSPSD